MQAAFEERMKEGWTRRDPELWLSDRLIYADWLEENDHPLARMARCDVRIRPVQANIGKNKAPWMWKLFFDFHRDWLKPRPRWWANQRLNAHSILGFPPYTLRCKGWGDDTKTLRFTLTFRPRPQSYRRINFDKSEVPGNVRKGFAVRYDVNPFVSAKAAKTIAVDADCHLDGFAAAFWRQETGDDWTPWDRKRSREVQGGLFTFRPES